MMFGFRKPRDPKLYPYAVSITGEAETRNQLGTDIMAKSAEWPALGVAYTILKQIHPRGELIFATWQCRGIADHGPVLFFGYRAPTGYGGAKLVEAAWAMYDGPVVK